MFKKLSFSKKQPQKNNTRPTIKKKHNKNTWTQKNTSSPPKKTQRNDSQEEANNERWRLEAERIAVKAEQVPPWRVKPKPKKMPKPNGIVDVRRKKRSTESRSKTRLFAGIFWCVLFWGVYFVDVKGWTENCEVCVWFGCLDNGKCGSIVDLITPKSSLRCRFAWFLFDNVSDGNRWPT